MGRAFAYKAARLKCRTTEKQLVQRGHLERDLPSPPAHGTKTRDALVDFHRGG